MLLDNSTLLIEIKTNTKIRLFVKSYRSVVLKTKLTLKIMKVN
jgi:hypothetical protein